jgi:small subunit ribosomal protein S8
VTMTDPIADYLTRVRNASRAKLKYVDIPASRVKAELSKILIDAGFLGGAKYMEDNKQGVLRIYLKYSKDMQGVISGIRRISKPSLRVYATKKKIPRVLGGYGMAVLSTSQGILSDKECKKRNIGGEVMCEIW